MLLSLPMYKRLLFICVLVVLSLPLLQWIAHIPQPSLKGVFDIPPKPVFTIQGWFSGTWQESYANYYEKNFGFRPYAIKINSQAEYGLFNQTKAWCTIGKDGYLFEPQYITSYLGENYRGTDVIASDIKKLEAVQRMLKQRGKELVVILAPGKADVYPEKIPDSFKPWAKYISNYDGYAKALALSQVHYIDFNSDFKKKRNQVNYPLYTKYGVHWSEYAAAFCADSLAAYLEKSFDKKTSRLKFDSVYYSHSRLESDYDMMLVMNLFWQTEKIDLPYHMLSSADTTAYKPNLLVVADSYYWTMINNGSAGILFSPQTHYWYYNKIQYLPKEAAVDVKPADLPKLIDEKDAIVFIYNVPNCEKFANGFVDQIYEVLTSEHQ